MILSTKTIKRLWTDDLGKHKVSKKCAKMCKKYKHISSKQKRRKGYVKYANDYTTIDEFI